MIFSNLFHRKKNKESETGSFSQYDQSEYAKLETKNIVKELNLSDAAQAKKYVVDLCKQMIQASKDAGGRRESSGSDPPAESQ